MCIFKQLAKAAAAAEGQDDWQAILKQYLCLACTAIRRTNARAVLRREAADSDPGQAMRAAQAAALAAAGGA